MYNGYNSYLRPYFDNTPISNPYKYPCPPRAEAPMYPGKVLPLRDYGPNPFVINIKETSLQNNTFRTALWTGSYLQLTLMSINVGDSIGLEMHPDVDQFIRLEQGQGLVIMGDSRDRLNYQQRVGDNCVILIPAGKWHNLINTGCVPLKLYSIYAPPQHPHGTVHKTKDVAEEHHV
ncbi:cupin [Desulfosporosinus sp. HMP52]|uniref:cupin domain-containing protein n=1 Tax=Desulfosporosinus sp. HMP52 TaxID=1487923 RepID=UPI00051FA74F|nr:cupin domain-containing protein [Desulfosporosinus sp. HMP52]KGK88361.1 cupin [Desulfosporosinus sp. HMP52]